MLKIIRLRQFISQYITNVLKVGDIFKLLPLNFKFTSSLTYLLFTSTRALWPISYTMPIIEFSKIIKTNNSMCSQPLVVVPTFSRLIIYLCLSTVVFMKLWMMSNLLLQSKLLIHGFGLKI